MSQSCSRILAKQYYAVEETRRWRPATGADLHVSRPAPNTEYSDSDTSRLIRNILDSVAPLSITSPELSMLHEESYEQAFPCVLRVAVGMNIQRGVLYHTCYGRPRLWTVLHRHVMSTCVACSCEYTTPLLWTCITQGDTMTEEDLRGHEPRQMNSVNHFDLSTFQHSCLSCSEA